MISFAEDTEAARDVKDYAGGLEECRCCLNYKTNGCLFYFTGIPGKCESFWLNDSSFNALEEMAVSLDDF